MKKTIRQQARAARQEAIRTGQTTYYSPLPCKRGHQSPRLVSTMYCVECKREVHDRRDYRKHTFRRALNTRRSDARKFGVPFDISEDQLEKPTHCPVLGIELLYEVPEDGSRQANRATIDRFDPNKGYVPGNVFVLSFRANRLKSDGTEEEFAMLLKWMKKINETS